MRYIIFIILFFLNTYSQELYKPLNILNAYNKKTRSYDGKPGSNYWQNKSDYFIKVSVEPSSRTVSGSEKIIYYNNSPDNLTEIHLRLYPNITKSTAMRDFNIPEKGITDGINIEKFLVNSKQVDITDKKVLVYTSTNARLFLDEELPPYTQIELEIDWSFKLPSTNFARFGTYDSTSFFIAYWYPQIAVYDDIDGWDTQEYTGYTEMYNDFNNYYVEITVPIDYHIWATGVWQNPQEILSKEYLDLYQKAKTSDEIIKIFKAEDKSNRNKYLSKGSKHTFIFKADEVPDFAFGMSNNYLWDATSYLSTDGDRIYICAAYRETSKDFQDVTFYAKESIKYFSEEMPGYLYPYPSCTVWNGSGGMEYPMIVNNGSANTKAGTVGLTAHEIAHQYMPFMMGINERKYAFMDEGWAVFFPLDFQDKMVKEIRHRARNISSFNIYAGREIEIPLIVPSFLLRGLSYRVSAYLRASVAYDMLYDFLGKDLFIKALHHYMNLWKGKHPIPWDFFNCFNSAIGEDLNWFFKPWFFDFTYPDLGLKYYKIDKNKIRVVVEKEGGLPIPIKIKFLKENNLIKEFYFKADVWKNGNKFYEIEIDLIQFDEILLGDENIPDVRDSNNSLKF